MNIVILGGGTAGWLTALFAKKIFPIYNVTLIQSKEVGIIGVGEASTPHLVTFMKNLDLDMPDLIYKTNGSIKNGINFVNWNGDGKRYFHSFNEFVDNFSIDNLFTHDCFAFYLQKLIKEKLPLEDFLYQFYLSYNNRVDLKNTYWSLHFDAGLLAKYLEEIGRSRGINVIEDKYISADLDKEGNIKNLILENRNQPVDFIFDCSGFHRELIGKLFKEDWISFSDHLPMKKAIPFWLDTQEDIEPYTSCIAMKYGWIWHIPLYHRTGCGYIFDSNYINVDQAKKEAEEYFGKEIEVRKIIDFEAGMYKNFWIKNCMAVGLSSSFLEPLESTSLWLTTQQLELFRFYANEITYNREYSLKQFNEIATNNVEEMMNFIYLHYYTKRDDSEFWKNFKENNPVPKKLISRLSAIKESNLRIFDSIPPRTTVYFGLPSWLMVAHGLDLFEKEIILGTQELVSPSSILYQNKFKDMIENFSDKNVSFLKGLHDAKNV